MIGKAISHYKILEKLGEGGMGVVYKAQDTKLRRTVALKFLPPELTRDEDAKRRFVREAQAASALQHHNICTIHEIDETPDSQLFICMDYYTGETLKEKIIRGPLPVGETMEIVTQVAAGLATAHGAGMIHRDIKPANIMVTNDGVVKIMDFGLAKLSGQTKVTKTGTTVGTIAYMSPEQATGEKVDERSDIFSLGVVLYELLTGEPPFEGEHEAALLYEIVHEEPKPLESHRRDLPQEFQTVIDRALHKDPGSRIQSARELTNELATLRESCGDESDRRRAVQSPGRDLKRIRLIGITVATVIVVAVALVFVYMQHRRETVSAKELSLAVMDFHDLTTSEDPTITAGITELVYIGLVEASPIRIQSQEYVRDFQRRLFGTAGSPIQEGQALEIARKSGATFVLTGGIWTLGDEQFFTWRLVDVKSGEGIGAQRVDSDGMIVLANKIVGSVLPLIAQYSGIEEPIKQVPVEQITTETSPAYQHYIKGKLMAIHLRREEAIDEYNKAVALDSSFALAYMGLARWYFGGRFDLSKANHYADLAWRFRSRLGIKDRMFLKAFRYRINYQVGQEIAALRDILELWPDDLEAIRGLAEGTSFWGLVEECIVIHEKGKQLYPDDIVIGGPGYLHSLTSLGRIEEAFHATKAYVEKHPDNPNSWDELALRYLAMGYPDSAASAYRKALEIDPEWYEEVFAYCAYHAGDLERAITIFKQNLEDIDIGEEKQFRLMIPGYNNISLAVLYLEAGRYHDVADICDEMRKYASENPVGSYFIGRLYVTIGQTEKAFQMAREMSQSDKVGMKLKARNIQGKLLAATGDLEGALADAAKWHEWADERGHFLHIDAYEIEVEIALAENDHIAALEALEAWKKMGVWKGGLLELNYRTMLASAYYEAGQIEKATEIHEELLRIFSGHALSHYELGKLYEEMNRPDDAKREYARFLEMWREADEDLPQLEDAKMRLARLKGV